MTASFFFKVADLQPSTLLKKDSIARDLHTKCEALQNDVKKIRPKFLLSREVEDQGLKYEKVRSSHRRRSVKKVFLGISQNLQESTCVRVSFLINWQGSGLQLY